MRRDGDGIDERFAVYVRDRGDRHLRVAVLLTRDLHAAEDLVQVSLVKLYRTWPRCSYMYVLNPPLLNVYRNSSPSGPAAAG
jgi:DNA-directed RNA polymerase specialized sigma24 family protein